MQITSICKLSETNFMLNLQLNDFQIQEFKLNLEILLSLSNLD